MTGGIRSGPGRPVVRTKRLLLSLCLMLSAAALALAGRGVGRDLT